MLPKDKKERFTQQDFQFARFELSRLKDALDDLDTLGYMIDPEPYRRVTKARKELVRRYLAVEKELAKHSELTPRVPASGGTIIKEQAITEDL